MTPCPTSRPRSLTGDCPALLRRNHLPHETGSDFRSPTNRTTFWSRRSRVDGILLSETFLAKHLRLAGPSRKIRIMQQHVETMESIDRDRREHFERAGARPVSRLTPVRPAPTKEVLKARGRRRTAAWRCSLDQRHAPESGTVGLALLAAVVSLRKHELDDNTAKIVVATFDDLMSRGYDRREIEKVFRRFKTKIVDVRLGPRTPVTHIEHRPIRRSMR